MSNKPKNVIAVIVDELPEDCWSCWCISNYNLRDKNVYGCVILGDEVDILLDARDPKCILMTAAEFVTMEANK